LAVEFTLHLDLVLLLAKHALALLLAVHHGVVVENRRPFVLVVFWDVNGGLVATPTDDG
jgi:hypothetical protein